ncbi:RraA family protein [Halalkalibaculum sp. DA3122]|uniref:RraA family protein n=1 Tax=unclassified Halalkalibaculum TaxID=2964617 RepID=UPI003754C6F3
MIFHFPLEAQEVQFSEQELIALTPEWEGDRYPDGRPKVPESLLERMKQVTLEEAWAVLRNNNYEHQYAENWQVLNPDSVLVGRALTATFMPGRPDVQRVLEKQGEKVGRTGSQNSWPVEMLQPGDVYVADQFGAHEDGPTIGDNVGNAIYTNSGNGIVYNGALRDVAGLKEIDGFTAFFRSYHPSHHLNNPDGELNTTLVGINHPTRIGEVMVMPGDVVLGRDGGVIFIPPHLAEQVATTSEIVRLRDMFGQQRIREGVYSAGQIDARWSEQIEKDFSRWLEDHIDELPVPKEQIQELLDERTW